MQDKGYSSSKYAVLRRKANMRPELARLATTVTCPFILQPMLFLFYYKKTDGKSALRCFPAQGEDSPKVDCRSDLVRQKGSRWGTLGK